MSLISKLLTKKRAAQKATKEQKEVAFDFSTIPATTHIKISRPHAVAELKKNAYSDKTVFSEEAFRELIPNCLIANGLTSFTQYAGFHFSGIRLERSAAQPEKYIVKTNYDSCPSCREELLAYSYLKNVTLMAVFCNKWDAEVAQSLINKVESILKLKDRTIVVKNRNNLFILSIPKWWSQNMMRRQFYTALIKVIDAYKTPTKDQDANKAFEKWLLNSHYFQDSKPAVRKFLNGFTKFPEGVMDNLNGWVETFNEYNVNKVRNLTLMKK